MAWLLASLSLLSGPQSHAGTWYLNGLGASGPYQIWAHGDDGFPLSTSPVISGASHIAWPSAIQVGATTRVYASVNSGRWNTVRLWTSTDGINFTDQGVVFSANGDEPYGVGPAYVMYDPSAAIPWTMYYLVRGASGPGQSIAVATSPDGLSWTRQGNVLSATLTEEAGGLSVSYACRRANGDYVLVYHGYSPDLAQGAALVAQSASATGLFSGKSVVKSPDSFVTTFSGTAGNNTGTIPSGLTVPLGIPLLVKSSAVRETIIAKRQDGTRVWFDRPLLNTYASADFYSLSQRKVDLSYVKELPDGTWFGIFTLYGPASGVAAEYTSDGFSSSLTGTWVYSGTGLHFSPWLPGTLYSAENPTPLVSNASCGN